MHESGTGKSQKLTRALRAFFVCARGIQNRWIFSRESTILISDRFDGTARDNAHPGLSGAHRERKVLKYSIRQRGSRIGSMLRCQTAPSLLLSGIVVFCFLSICAGGQVTTKPVHFRLADADGKTHALEDYSGRIIVLEFWSFKCPPSGAYDERMIELHTKYRDRGVTILAVDSNKNESTTDVRLNREHRKLPYPVLMDTEGTLAESLGATRTPSVAILDGTGALRYRGAIDNNKHSGEQGRSAYVEDALDAILSGKPVPQSETILSGGCSIRR
jgi:peroxiredoxin